MIRKALPAEAAMKATSPPMLSIASILPERPHAREPATDALCAPALDPAFALQDQFNPSG
jgi:hypothetical protein